MQILLYPLLIPVLAAVVTILLPKKYEALTRRWTLFVTALNLIIAVGLFRGEWTLVFPWGGWFEFSFRLYHFSSFILLATAGFAFLIALYCLPFMKGKEKQGQFFTYFLLTLGMVNGAVLADDFILFLFFWESLLLTLFGFIAIGHKGAYKTAVKAFIIVGVADLCMMAGIGITAHLAGTFTISKIALPAQGLGALAFVFLMIGAISKAGAMPFHSWIPDAAIDAHLPFMAFLPASLEKLLGIYFLSRISLDLFQITHESWLSMLMMIIGAVTILLAVLMALIQRDYKRLLSYHAISQVGYMVLGVGTAVPAGIVGGIFHMINHAMYKSCLFLTGGSVEKQAGTTDLGKLGGLASRMPITFVCFIIAAAAISGVPPLNGFFSKELVYDGALERGFVFYLAALVGSFLTAASFLKLGHAAYVDRARTDVSRVKEAPIPMLIPMIVIAALCVLFGVYNALPLENLIQPILGDRMPQGPGFAGWPGLLLTLITLGVLVGAYLNHWGGAQRKGSGLDAVDHIHYAPGMHGIYDMAEKRYFDPYDIGMKIARGFSLLSFWVDRAFDAIYDHIAVAITYALSNGIRRAHTGNYSTYIIWSLVAIFLMAYLAIK